MIILVEDNLLVENIKYGYREDGFSEAEVEAKAKKSTEAMLPFAVGAAGAVTAGSHIENKNIRKFDESYQRKYKNTK